MDEFPALEELLVILALEVTLLVAIAVIKTYRSRTDVLTGPYILEADHRPDSPAAAQTRFDATNERLSSTTEEYEARASSPQFPAQLEEDNRSALIHLDQIHERRPLRGSPGPPSEPRRPACSRLHAALRAVDKLLHSRVLPGGAAARGSGRAGRSHSAQPHEPDPPTARRHADVRRHPQSGLPPAPPK